MEQNKETVEILVNLKQAQELGPVFLQFNQQNNEVLKDGYLDFLNDNQFGLTENDCPYPTYCFSLFLIELEKL